MFELHITWWEMGVRLLVAVVLGALLGWDREAHNKPAGMRTFMMVAIGSTGLALIADSLFEVVRLDSEHFRGVDPTRLLEGIIGGIGFIGAGTIIRGEAKVEGITTAACIWLTAAVGIALGVGLYALAVVLALLGVVVLVVVGRFTIQSPSCRNGDDGRR